MLKTTLQFHSLFALWRFKISIRAMNVIVLVPKNLLICDLTDKEINLACLRFAAKVIA